MIKKFFTNKKSFFLAIVFLILSVSCIIFLMNHVQFLLNSDVRINLTEIVTQNKDVIASKIAVELNEIELAAKQIADKLALLTTNSQAYSDKVFMQYAKDNDDYSLVFANKNGRALSARGKEFDISGRAYFKHGITGVPTISERVISRENGDDVFVFCVPLIYKDEILGTLQKQYTPAEMYSLCTVSLFSEQGSTYIINSDGYVLISSEKSKYSLESDNYYRILYLDDSSASKKLEADILAGNSGFMETTINGVKTFFAYTPIDTIYNWYLISSLPTNTVSPNANIVVKIFYCILFTVVFCFALFLLYFWLLKKKQQQSLEKIAFVDPVTDGSSYIKFSMDLEALIYRQEIYPLYICAFDIDNFKYINSFYSFEAGNIILKELHDRYSAKLGPNEFIARMTADKYVMLLTDASEERLKELVEFEIVIDGIKVYISSGLYKIPEIPQNVDLMVDKAQIAAQRAKGMHFKKVEVHSEEIDDQISHNEQMKRAIEFALENGEIIPFFQPKVNIHNGALIGAEALARWKTLEGQVISPADFIPICEKTGLISIVDMRIFEDTLKFIKSNLDNGVKCYPISVNFSRLHLLNEDFVHTIVGKIENFGVPPELIEIELTETVIFENFETIAAFIDEAHSHGLKISMDDFGTGYSSLHMLKNAEIDVLKIDRSFLMDTAKSDRQKIIFGAIIQMADKLNIEVIVEGVETDENVELLMEFGCDYAQGYYYSHPMSIEKFEKVYKEGTI